MLYFGGSNPIKYGVLIVQKLKDFVAILIAERRVPSGVYKKKKKKKIISTNFILLDTYPN